MSGSTVKEGEGRREEWGEGGRDGGRSERGGRHEGWREE